MTKPIIRCPGIKERRAARRAFKALKARVAASPSMAAYREQNRAQHARHRARQKVYAATIGEVVRPLTRVEYEACNDRWRADAKALGLAPGAPVMRNCIRATSVR